MNYGVGNLYSITQALRREGVETEIVTRTKALRDADAVVLPGVGGFQKAASRIPREEVRDLAMGGKTIVGICLGMQLFLEGSEEGPGNGLGLFPGRVRRLPGVVKVPQMGWNTLKIKRSTELTDDVRDGSWVYFVHSYYPDTTGEWVQATCDYGIEFPSLIGRKNIIGTQFHPEKSGAAGAKILHNIIRMAS
jgi:imidazole glycerol-phosphate synthase subunit HisH